MGHIISYITGATDDGDFGGLAGGYVGRRDLLHFDALDPETPNLTFRFRRTAAVETIEVSYNVSDILDGGPVIGNL